MNSYNSVMKTWKIGILISVITGISFIQNPVKGQDMAATNKSLSTSEKSIVTISSLTAKGSLRKLETELNDGLEAGLTINEIKEILVQLYAYCGFPRSLNAINTFNDVLKERKAKGIKDASGREASPVPYSPDKYEQGRKTLEALTKTVQPKPAKGYGEFVPRIDIFLKEHLFADIFENDILNHRQRELVTIAALAAMPGVEAQLTSHMGVGKNTGITDNELLLVADLIEQHINPVQANILRKLIGKASTPIIDEDRMVRISEIEILPEYLEEYYSILKEEAAASIKIEPGVIAIYPMYQVENPAQIRIVEIYASKAAYQSHLQTPHFKHYKKSTLKMVKALKLLDMKSVDEETMTTIFKKIE